MVEHDEAFEDFADALLDRHDARGYFTGEDLVRALTEALDGVGTASQKHVDHHMTSLFNSALENAKGKIGKGGK